MTAFVLISMYCGMAIFVIGCVWRIRRYASLPRHLRWELYPVPHEPAKRAAYGGSYFEETEWWTKPRCRNRIGETWAMFEEIFLLKTVRQSNRALWWRSQLFHSGLFLVIASLGCGMLELILRGRWLTYAALFGRTVGYIGLLAILAGAGALLWRRVSDPDLRDYTHAADIAHLILILLAAGLVIAGALPPRAPGAGQIIRAVVLFDTGLNLPPLLAGALFLCAALFAYIPFSRMAHFIGKYFAYHAVRWDDAPNRGGRLSAALAANREFRPNWSAEHIGANGRESWVEIASENPAAAGASK